MILNENNSSYTQDFVIQLCSKLTTTLQEKKPISNLGKRGWKSRVEAMENFIILSYLGIPLQHKQKFAEELPPKETWWGHRSQYMTWQLRFMEAVLIMADSIAFLYLFSTFSWKSGIKASFPIDRTHKSYMSASQDSDSADTPKFSLGSIS